MLECHETSSEIKYLSDMIECPSCGLFQKRLTLNHGELAYCERCHRQLYRHPQAKSWQVPFAFALCSLIAYIMMLSFPLLTVNIYGRENSLGVIDGPITFFHEGWRAVGILVGMVIIFFPVVTIGLSLILLSLEQKKEQPSWTAPLLHCYKLLRPWSMIEVYILGVFVAYTKLVDMAYVTIDYALYAILLLMVCMSITDATFDFINLWKRCPIKKKTVGPQKKNISVTEYQPEELPNTNYLFSCQSCHLVFTSENPVPSEEKIAKCPRCGQVMRKRKKDSLARAGALLISAFILYIPANLYPVMTMTMMGKSSDHRIFQGVVELWQSHMVPLALLVFFASIIVPVSKIIGIVFMISACMKRSKRALIFRSRLFQVICFIGRWSMIDVFMISILIALIRFNLLANVVADGGIFAFASVVILTIFAADCFDPRLMWDYAGLNSTFEVDRSDRESAVKKQIQPVTL